MGFLFIIQGILSLTLKLLASIEHLLSAMCLTFLKTKPNSAFQTLDFSLFFSLLLCLPQVIIPPAFSAPASMELNEAEEKHSHAGYFGFKFMAVIFVGLLCCSVTSDISLISSLSPLLVACWIHFLFSSNLQQLFLSVYDLACYLFRKVKASGKSFRSLPPAHPFGCIFAHWLWLHKLYFGWMSLVSTWALYALRVHPRTLLQ